MLLIIDARKNSARLHIGCPSQAADSTLDVRQVVENINIPLWTAVIAAFSQATGTPLASMGTGSENSSARTEREKELGDPPGHQPSVNLHPALG